MGPLSPRGVGRSSGTVADVVRELARALTVLLVLAATSLAVAQESSVGVATSLAAPDASAADGATSAAPPQEAAGASPRRADQLDPASPLTLRPAAELRSLADRVARMLQVRAQVPVVVGEPPPGGVPEAVLASHVGIVRDGPEVLVVLGGPQGLVYQSRVDLPSSRDAAVRAVGLTVEALRDAAIEGPPPRDEGEGPGAAPGERVSFVYLEPEGGLFGVRRRIEPIARPTIYLRLLLGFSTARDTALIGPGVGVGLCIEMSCLVLEGDLPLLPEERVDPADLRIIRYRPISLGMRLQIRPWRWGDFMPGLTFGVLTRFGNAWVDSTCAHPCDDSEEKTVNSFGLRGTVELAWIFAEPFEAVLEGGVDFVASPARFARNGNVVLLEDIVTVWGMISMRLRP